MSAHVVTLQLPAPLYDHFRRRAEQGQRSVEAELLEVVRTAASETAERLPQEVAEELAGLAALGDQDLWQTARSHLPSKMSAELEALNLKQKNEGLTQGEKERLTQLLYQYDHYMLIRAQAAKLLKERGHDVSSLLAST